MTGNFYAPPDSALESQNQRPSRVRLFAFGLVRTFSVVCFLLALFAIYTLALGVLSLIAFQKEFVEASAGEIGAVTGKFVGAPFIMGIFFMALAWKSWHGANRMITQRNLESGLTTTSFMVRFKLGSLKILFYIFGTLTALNGFEVVLAIFTIQFISADQFDHTLFKFDYLHEIYLWFPLAQFLCFSIITAAIWKIKKYLLRTVVEKII